MVYKIDHSVDCRKKNQVPLISAFTFVNVRDWLLFRYSDSTSFDQRFWLALARLVILVVDHRNPSHDSYLLYLAFYFVY